MMHTDTINFETVDALGENAASVLTRYVANEVTSPIADVMTSDDMTEIFECYLTQLTAIEVLECIIYREDHVDREFLVQYHELNECHYGFSQLRLDTVEKTRHFKFDNAKDAFKMIAEIITV